MKITPDLLISLSSCAYADGLHDVSNALLAIVDLLPSKCGAISLPESKTNFIMDFITADALNSAPVERNTSDHTAKVIPLYAASCIRTMLFTQVKAENDMADESGSRL